MKTLPNGTEISTHEAVDKVLGKPQIQYTDHSGYIYFYGGTVIKEDNFWDIHNSLMGKIAMDHYNPDWAVAFREGSVKHVYFVAETKGNEWQRSQLRGAEDCKLECAARHFEAISQSGNVIYGVARDYKTLYDKVMK